MTIETPTVRMMTRPYTDYREASQAIGAGARQDRFFYTQRIEGGYVAEARGLANRGVSRWLWAAKAKATVAYLASRVRLFLALRRSR